MKTGKILALFLSCIMAVAVFAGCAKKVEFDASRDITVISREDGSGTRGAFVELFGIEQKDENDEKIDRTVLTADITHSTGVMIASFTKCPRNRIYFPLFYE